MNCSLGIQAPIGSDTFDVKLYDGISASGHMLSEGTGAASVTGAPQTIDIVMQPLVASIVLNLPQPPAGPCGVGQLDTTAPLPVSVLAMDGSGATITSGPWNYLNPITLTNSDQSGSSTLSTTNIQSPAATVTMSYSGLDYTVPITIGASASGVPPDSVSAATLDLGADRPLVPGSQSIYTLQTYAPAGVPYITIPEIMTISANATFPAPAAPSVFSYGAAPSIMCQLHITNQHTAGGQIDWGLDALALTDTEDGSEENLYFAAVAKPNGADTDMFASQGFADGHLDVPYHVADIPANTTFPTSDLLGFLPHTGTRMVRPAWTTAQGHTQHVPPSLPQLEDLLNVQSETSTATISSGYIANPSGSAFILQGSSTSTAFPAMTATDVGIETIPSGCAVGPGIPTTAIHIMYANPTGGVANIVKRRPESQRPTDLSQTEQLDEWVRRDVGLVCRRYMDPYYLGYVSLQSYTP